MKLKKNKENKKQENQYLKLMRAKLKQKIDSIKFNERKIKN